MKERMLLEETPFKKLQNLSIPLKNFMNIVLDKCLYIFIYICFYNSFSSGILLRIFAMLIYRCMKVNSTRN